jgi:hypothetical protein
MESIILCVTENNIPLSVLFLGDLNLDLKMMGSDMKMIFKMNTLKGSNISTENDIST